MSISYSESSLAIETVNELQAELEGLATMLRLNGKSIRIDAIYGIEFRNTPSVSKVDPIPVQALHRDEAIIRAIQALTSIWRGTGQHARETLRAPGAIGLPGEMLEKVLAANAIRKRLFDLVHTLTVIQRRHVWGKFSGISPLQALRVTPVLSDPRFISFYWDTGSSTTRIQAKDLIAEWDEILKQDHGGRRSMEEALEGTVERKLLFAIDKLVDLRDTTEQVAIHRPVAPHIRARFQDGEPLIINGKRQPLSVVQAPSPFVYSIDCPPFEIHPLTDFVPGVKKDGLYSSAKLEEHPYIESMNVYLYQEKYKAYGPVVPKKKSKRHERRKPE